MAAMAIEKHRKSWADLSEEPEAEAEAIEIFVKDVKLWKNKKSTQSSESFEVDLRGFRLELQCLPEKERPIDAGEGDSAEAQKECATDKLESKSSGALLQAEACCSWMWVLPSAEGVIECDPTRNRVFEKKGEIYCLWWAKVAPRDTSQRPCFQCHKPTSNHEKSCDYKGQVPCAWCNRFPCKHMDKCCRKNFSCVFCHYSSSGHCVGSVSDTRKYSLDY